jgi:phosphate transport system substrate-binding protein
LRLSPDVLADIYLAKITNWNDSRIAKDNPGQSFPDLKITVVHRSDGSGTTFIFTSYLSKVSQDWKGGPGAGSAINWPTGVGGKGNDNVTSLVRQLDGSIGYIELYYALQNNVPFASLKNASGNWVKASLDGVTAAGGSVKNMPADYRVDITNAPGADAYPISSFTYLLIPLQPKDATNEKVIKDMLSWIIKSGESEAPSLSYAPLPQAVADKVLQTVYKLP